MASPSADADGTSATMRSVWRIIGGIGATGCAAAAFSLAGWTAARVAALVVVAALTVGTAVWRYRGERGQAGGR
jgi:hypothetical protein